jgi:predicted nucleic-acid-binding protein
MRGLDTNVLVRYLVTDDAKQTGLAERIVEPAVISDFAAR